MEALKLNQIDEILENQKIGKTKEEFRKIVVNMIMDLESKYYKLYKLNMKYTELFNKKTKYINRLNILRQKIVKLKKYLFQLDTKRRKENWIKKEKNMNFPVFHNQIIDMDLKYKLKTYELIVKLILEDNPKIKIDVINELQSIYTDLIKNISKEDYQIKIQVKYILSYLSKLARSEKVKIRKLELKETLIMKDENSVKNMPDYNIYHDILNGNNISEYALAVIISSFKNIIMNYEINENLIKCVDNIIDRFNEKENSSEVYMNYLYSMIDSIKLRKQKFDRNSKERLILNQLLEKLNEFENILSYYNDEFENIQAKYLYDIVCTLLYDEDGYLIIKKILEKIPKSINATSENKHVLEYIVELYLKNYEKLIVGNKINYINIDYLKEVYYLFIDNADLGLSKEVKNRIDNQLNNFIKRITSDKNQKQIVIDNILVNTIIVKNDKRKNYIVEEITKLASYCGKVKYELKELDQELLEKQINCITGPNSNYENSNNTIDLTKEENLILDNNYISYNYKNTYSSNILRVSVCDMAGLISEYTDINNYIYNQTIEGKKLDKRILNRLKFKDGEEVPAITFKISLDENNKPISLYIYKSRIKPKKIDDSNNEMYKQITKVVNDIMNKRDYDFDTLGSHEIEIVLRNLINELYLSFAKDNGIPFTYSGVEKAASIKPNIYSNVGQILNNLNKKQATNIHDVLTSNLGEFHYSSKPFPVYGDFDLNLVGEPNYIFLENQRILKALVLSKFESGIMQNDLEKEILVMEHQNMVIDLNGSVNYKGIEDFDYKTRKKKKKILTPIDIDNTQLLG